MSKKTLLLAPLFAAAFAPAAMAQSSVTLYGRFNVSIENERHQREDRTTDMLNNASRIGVRGVEDLGGGLTAGFVLEHGFDIDTGMQSQSAFWARQSEVNLGSATYGTVRLGNFTSDAYYAVADYVSLHNHDTGTSADKFYAYVGRDTDKIAYMSPTWGGVVLHAAVSLNEGVGPRTYEAAAYYDLDKLHLGAGYGRAGDVQQASVRALYELGDFTFGGYVQWDENAFLEDGGTRWSGRLAGMYTMGASEFHVNFGYAGDYENRRESDAHQYTFAYNYNLSKRTKLYTYFTRLGDDRINQVYGGNYDSIAVGMRHNF